EGEALLIRVNLLPQKREVKRSAEGNQGWLLVVLGAVVVEIIGFVLFHQVKREELARQMRTNVELSSQIEQIKKTVVNHTEIKAQLEVLRACEDAISRLQQARTGPTAVLLELARVMTEGRG